MKFILQAVGPTEGFQAHGSVLISVVDRIRLLLWCVIWVGQGKMARGKGVVLIPELGLIKHTLSSELGVELSLARGWDKQETKGGGRVWRITKP